MVPSEAAAKRVVDYQKARMHLKEQAVLEAQRKAVLDARSEEQKAKADLEAAEGRIPWFIKKSKARQQERESRQAAAREAAIARRHGSGPKVTTEFHGPNLVPMLLKADSAGSLEALRESLSHYPTHRVQLQVVKAELGNVSEGDVELAEALGATIVGFNVNAPKKVQQQAENVAVAGKCILIEREDEMPSNALPISTQTSSLHHLRSPRMGLPQCTHTE